jgi:hypothetical protein
MTANNHHWRIKMKGLSTVACIAMLAVPAMASAQAGHGCDAINIGPQVLAAFPRAKEACQGVLTKGDQPFMKLTGEVQSANSETVTVNFLDRNQKPLSQVVFGVNNPDTRISVSGTPTRVSRLQRGTRVNFYIQHNRWGLFADPDSTPLTILSRTDLGSAQN